MVRGFLVSLFLLLIVSDIPITSGQSSGASPGAGTQSPEQQVIDAERKWLDALHHLDVATIESGESNDFTFVTPPAMITKQEHLTMFRQRLADAAQPEATYLISRQTVRIYGAMALVTDIQSVESRGGHPVISSGRYWQTEIWRNEGGAWKLVHMHMSPVVRRQ